MLGAHFFGPPTCQGGTRTTSVAFAAFSVAAAMLSIACSDPAAPNPPPKVLPKVSLEEVNVPDTVTRIDVLGYTNGQTVYLNRLNNYALTFDADVFERQEQFTDENFYFLWGWGQFGPLGLSLATNTSNVNGFARFYAIVNAETATGDGSLIASTLYSNPTLSDGVYIRVSAPRTVVASPSSVSLTLGQTAQLSSVTRDHWNTDISASYANLRSYTSTNSQIASVSSTGLVTATDCGTANVSVTAADSRFSATSNAIPVMVSPPCKLRISIQGPIMVRAGDTCTFTATISGGQAPFVSSNWYARIVGTPSFLYSNPTSSTTVSLPLLMNMSHTGVQLNVSDDNPSQSAFAVHPVAVLPPWPIGPLQFPAQGCHA